MSVSEDSINLCLMSSVHACKETLYVSFRDSSTVQDVLNYYLIRVQAPGIGKVSYILLNDQRVPCKPESTLSKVLGKDVKSASLILSVSQVSETRRLDLILIIGICYFFWITSLVIGLVMYLTHGWSSHGGSLTIINAYSHGTELYLFKSHERNARFTCSINSSAGISVLINSPSELNLKYYFTNFHCFNKSLSSSVYLGATDGLRELNQTLPCETRELMTKVKNTLSSIVSDSFVEILTNTKQGILGWRGIHSKSGGNQTTADWGKFSLQVTFPTKDSNQTNNLNYLTLDNYGGKNYINSNTYNCYGDVESHRRFLVTLYYQEYIETGDFPEEVIDPCLNTEITYSFSDLFQNNCTLKMIDFNFLVQIKEYFTKRIQFIPGYLELESCSSKIEQTLSICKEIFEESCFESSIEIPGSKVYGLRGGFSTLKKQLSMNSSSPSDKEWELELKFACSSSNSTSLCFRGNFIRSILGKSAIKFEDTFGWPQGYADDFFSKERPKDSFTTLSPSAFTLLMILSTSFCLIGSFFVYEAHIIQKKDRSNN